MEQIRALLETALGQYPLMKLEDTVKLLYQCAFGPGHLIADEVAVLTCLTSEFNDCKGNAPVCVEPIGNGLCRVHLAGAKDMGLSPDTLFRLFARCASLVKPQPQFLKDGLALLPSLGFSSPEERAFLDAYRAKGCPPLHHSAAYRDAYHPAYRICLARDARFLPLLAALDRQLAGHTAEHPLFLAIDGPAASGKSTLAALLAELYPCTVLHMDDFFLPPERKTPERLHTPGGNVDYERFDAELLAPLLAGQPALLRPFDCQTGQVAPPSPVPRQPLMVAEGSYSLHPALIHAYALRVFLSVPPEVQRRRIAARNGPAMAERFAREWIPLENRYFEAFQIARQCDFQFE